MTVVWRAFAAGSESARRGVVSAARAATPTLCSLGVAAMLGATLCSAAAPAGASATPSLHEQAAELSQQMILEQLQIGGFQQQRVAYMQGVVADDAQLKRLETRLAATEHALHQDRVQLRVAAVRTYVDGGTQADGMSALFADTPSESASTVYAQVMNADLTSAVSRLQSELRALHTQEAMKQQVSVQARHQLTGADSSLAAAQSTEVELTQQRVSVLGQLAIAHEQAQEAAAEAAQEAQDAQEAQSPASTVTNAAADAPSPSTASTAPSAHSASPASASGSTGALPQLNAFLTCVVQAESDGDYQVVSPTGQYMGAFQFAQPTWDVAAGLAGLPTLVGVPPYEASMRDQDLLAIALYNADGEQPWYDPCTS